MVPDYQEARTTTLLGADDIAGISALYPVADGDSTTTTTTAAGEHEKATCVARCLAVRLSRCRYWPMLL